MTIDRFRARAASARGIVLLLTGALALAGCGSSSGNSATSGPGAGASAPASGGAASSQQGSSPAVSLPAGSSPASSPTGGTAGSVSSTGSMSSTSSDTRTPSSAGMPSGSAGASSGAEPNEDATAAIKEAYATFFGPDSTTKQTLNSLQNGKKFADVVAEQGQGSMSSMAAGAGVKVSKVSMVSPTVAKVTYTILVNNKPMLKDQTGYAVKQGGRWKLSDYTFCGLMRLEMGKNAPKACSAPKVTQPPG
jgi:hypothetical protein